MSQRAKRISWVLWGICSLAGGVALADRLAGEERSRALFLPGRTTDGHYQIELECGACHTKGFTDADDLQAACVTCHEAELAVSKDSHPTTKFTDPRNAERVAILDGRYCVTCHAEHRPERTSTMGLSLPGDYCFHCHQDIGKERATHVGLAFDSCASTGCHNFHDNRALYEDYLAARGAEPWLTSAPLVSGVESARGTVEPPRVGALEATDADGPAGAQRQVANWSASAHASGGVNCSGCHGSSADPFQNEVPVDVCGRCHQAPTEGWLAGRHGMRVKAGLEPMRVEDARRPMKAAAHGKDLSCASCHGDHGTITQEAAFEACEGCHDDEHTRAYRRSKHFTLLMDERGERSARGSGVSCATCHMPGATDDNGKLTAQHNQNDNLRPADKMIRSACEPCHGVAFSIDALADRELIRTNFDRAPTKHVASVDFARSRAE